MKFFLMQQLVTICITLLTFQTCLKVQNEGSSRVRDEPWMIEDTTSIVTNITDDTLRFEDHGKGQLVVFKMDLQPILESNCQPCHFKGGKMYDRLPFDEEATIYTLGDKIFSRIKDSAEVRLFNRFLSQNSFTPIGE